MPSRDNIHSLKPREFPDLIFVDLGCLGLACVHYSRWIPHPYLEVTCRISFAQISRGWLHKVAREGWHLYNSLCCPLRASFCHSVFSPEGTYWSQTLELPHCTPQIYRGHKTNYQVQTEQQHQLCIFARNFNSRVPYLRTWPSRLEYVEVHNIKKSYRYAKFII